MIRIALPNKGRLSEGAREILERAGLRISGRPDRALHAPIGEQFQALFVRCRDIPEFVADGVADIGITGRDMAEESGRDLDTLVDLDYGRCRLVIATREEGEINTLSDLQDGSRVATSFPRLTERFFAARSKPVELVAVSGAAEAAPHLGVADVIVDLVSTGSTLKTNGLREIATVLESSAVLITSKGGDGTGDRSRQLSELVIALESVIRARDKRYLMANVPRAALDSLPRIIPGISGPTIVDVIDSGEMVAAHAVVEQSEIYRVIADLKSVGATGILVTRIERLMP